MAERFVELDRKFSRVPKIEGDDKDLSDFSFLGSFDGESWSQLLNYSRVIILAEAGSGKTAEIKNQASKLKAKGTYSFFLRLEDIKSDFEFSFESAGDNSNRFNEWLVSDETAYFFLDSVDEAKLKNERDFSSAIRAFNIKLGSSIKRACIHITSRGSAWRAATDLQFVNEQLCHNFNPNSETESEQGFNVFTFNNLSTEDIKQFSREKGVENITEFTRQLSVNEVEDFANRPLDLIDLIKYWKSHNKIGSRLELVENSITTKIRAIELGRDLADLSFSKLSQGAEEIAAAMTFCKQSSVTVFGCEPTDNALTIEQILKDWGQGEIETLLSRPIFEPSLYGTSRFSHRLIREYLTAQWINKRVEKKSISQDQLHSLFYKEIYDVEVLVPSLKPVLAWYVLLDKKFAEIVIKRSPEVFIDGGDSSKLHIETRKQLISKFCELYSKKEQCFITFDSAAIKRFSTPELGRLTNCLLKQYYSYKDLRQILLQIAESSSMSECLEVATNMSLDKDIDPLSLTLALRIIKSVSKAEVISTHALEVLKITPKDSDRIFSVVVSELGHSLPLDLLLETITALDMSIKRRGRDIQYYIERFAEELDIDQSIESIKFLSPLINEKPYMNKFRCEISEKYEWLIGVIQRLLFNIISHKRAESIDVQLLDSLSKVSTYDKNSYHSDGKLNEKLQKIVNSWKELNNELFWFEVDKSRARLATKADKTGTAIPLNKWFQAGAYPSFWKFKYESLTPAIEWVDSKELTDDKFVAFSLAWELVKQEGRKPADEEKLDAVAESLPGASELLENFRNPKKEDWEIKDEKWRKKHIEDQAKEEQEERDNTESWLKHIKENMNLVDTLEYAEEGNSSNVQLHLYHNVSKDSFDSNSYLVDNCDSLIEKFGNEVANRFSEFLVKYWKCFQDEILISEGSKRNSTTYATIMALCGIEIENKLDPDWVDGICAQDAISATRLSLCELNDIPSWMEKVYAKYPLEVLSVYVPCLEWCYKNESEKDDSSFVLDKLVSSCKYLHEDISNHIYDLLKDCTISKYQLLKQSIWLISLSGLSNDRLAELAKFKLESESEPDNVLIYMWWALLIGTEPDDSLILFEKKLESLSGEDATKLAINVLNSLNDRRGFGALTNREQFMNVSSLVTLYKLMHQYIREEDDIVRSGGGAYSPTSRDDAQDARNSLFSSLKEIPGEESYRALQGIANMWTEKPWRESWIEHMALERAALDADILPMKEQEFVNYIDRLTNSYDKELKQPLIIGSFLDKTLDLIKTYLIGSISKVFLTLGITLLFTGIPGILDYIKYVYDTSNGIKPDEIKPVFDWPQYLGSALIFAGVIIRTVNHLRKTKSSLKEERTTLKETYQSLSDAKLQDEFERLYKIKNVNVSSIKTILSHFENKNAVIKLFESGHTHVLSKDGWFVAKQRFLKTRTVLGGIFFWFLVPLAIFTLIFLVSELITPGITNSGAYAIWGYVLVLTMIIFSSIYIHIDHKKLRNAVRLINYNALN